MTEQTAPRYHNEVYPFISPEKYKNALDSQVVVITGAAGAIGAAIAKCFGIAGAIVYLVDLNVEALEPIKAASLKLGAKAAYSARLDVADFDNCKAVIEKVEAEAGPIDVLVNCAGVGRMGVFHLTDPKWFLRGMAVNLNGPYYLMRLVLPGFLKRRRGVVINIASRSGTVNLPLMSDYHTSKAALIRLTAVVQKEVDLYKADDVHLYSLHPGGVLSDMALHSPRDDSIRQEFPEALDNFKLWLPHFKVKPSLPGMVSVALAAGVGKEVLRGRYIDVDQDLEDVIKQGEALKADPELNNLGVKFLGGLPNDGGMEHQPVEQPFTMPEGF